MNLTAEETVTIEMARSDTNHAYFAARNAKDTLRKRFDDAPNDWQDSSEGQELQMVIDALDDVCHKLKHAFVQVPEVSTL